uniref:autotransporter outer membrane beta-barrel domain-containing protein n=1 Tax=Castellaniella defragrans TaxID=75697 RepID=UPI00334278D4
MSRNISGGYSKFGAVTGNAVVISSGSVKGSVYGGYSYSGDVIGNTVEISDGWIGGLVRGGLNWREGAVTGNTVTVSGGVVTWSVIGGESTASAVTGNTARISGGFLNWYVIGGRSSTGDAIGNTLAVSGGTLSKNAYGGWSKSGTATGNTVEISGGDVGAHVYGGWSESGAAIGNTVIVLGAPQFNAANTFLFGGGTNSGSVGDVFTGNTLDFSARPIGVDTIANFQHYNFTLDPGRANDMDTALITADRVDFGNGNGTSSEVRVVGIQDGKRLSAGDEFLLTKADRMNGSGSGQNTQAPQGMSLLYDVQTLVNADQGTVTARILGVRASPRLKALSEGRLAGLMLATRGADAVADDLYHTIQADNRGGLTPFILAAGGRSRYDSGSHIDSDDFLLTGGLSYRRAGLTAAVFAESGWGNYDTTNSFAHAASVRGDGDTRYTGGGVFGRYDFASGPYAEASVRLGNTRTSFGTGDLVNAASGESARYKLNSRYTSAHVGVGYPWVFDERNLLDVSLKYLWTHVQGKDAMVTGDPLHFDGVQSQRLRLSGEWRHRHSDSLTLLAGLGYEHEFDAQADGTAYGYAIEAPSLKGSTGILSLGATITPTSNRRLSVDLRGQGYAGKRQGAGGSVRVNYAF